MKKIITILKDFVNLFTKLAYIAGYQRLVFHTYILQTLKSLLYFQKTSEESNITKQEITIWRLEKNNFD